jgi:ATP-dependent Lon protease
VRDVILPTDVRQNVEEDLMPEQIEGVTIHYASHIEDVLAVVLPKTKKDAVQDDALREQVLSQAS